MEFLRINKRTGAGHDILLLFFFTWSCRVREFPKRNNLK